MDFEQVGNKGQTSGTSSSDVPELADLDREFAELVEDFDLDENAGSSELSELDAAIEGTELDVSSSESTGQLSLLDIADGVGPESDAEFWNPVKDWIKKKARRLIRKLIALVRKYSKYKPCVPKVLKAVAAFKAGKWGTALRLAYAAYRCIKSK